MWFYEYLSSVNILDIAHDVFFYIQHDYPQIFTSINTMFTSVYSYMVSFLLFISNTIYIAFNMKYLNSAVFNMGIKFILLIALLVFVRGGIPRYRFDFLTKIGWIKFLSLILSVFLSSMLLIFLF